MEGYCITLEEVTHRRKSAEVEISKLPPDIKVQWSVEKRDVNGVRGCYNSHINVMKKALYRNLPYVLILEDDLHVKNWDAEVWNNIKRFIAENEFDFIQLGFCSLFYHNVNPVSGYKNLYSGSLLCSHASVYSRRMMEHMVNYYSEFTGDPIDVIYSNEFNKKYAVIPMMIGQHWCLGTNVQITNTWCFWHKLGYEDIVDWYEQKPWLKMGLIIILLSVLIWTSS
jgi:glycosyl transferase family 25